MHKIKAWDHKYILIHLLWLGGLYIVFIDASVALAQGKTPSVTAPGLVEEVMSQAEHPHIFDWRKSSVEIDVGYDYVDEANNFETEGCHLGFTFPTLYGMHFRTALRRYWVYGTSSSELVSKTPFRQPAQSSRYELMFGAGISLLEGRSITRLSPTISDLEHALFFNLGVHYNHPTTNSIPKLRDHPPALAGQEPANSKYIGEVGFRWHIYLPQSLGIFFELNRQYPVGGPGADIGNWLYLSGGLLWSIGS